MTLVLDMRGSRAFWEQIIILDDGLPVFICHSVSTFRENKITMSVSEHRKSPHRVIPRQTAKTENATLGLQHRGLLPEQDASGGDCCLEESWTLTQQSPQYPAELFPAA